MTERKINAMHKLFGTCGIFRCATCKHLIGGKYHDRQYYKCELYGLSHGESTDWRLKYQACGMFNMPIDMDKWVPVLEQIKHAPRGPEPPLEGQIRMI